MSAYPFSSQRELFSTAVWCGVHPFGKQPDKHATMKQKEECRKQKARVAARPKGYGSEVGAIPEEWWGHAVASRASLGWFGTVTRA
jgi:hypothetical protein